VNLDATGAGTLAATSGPGAARQNEEWFQLLLTNVIDYAIFVIDPDGAISSWNAGAERMMGYRADEILGKPFHILFIPDLESFNKFIREMKVAAEVGHAEDEGWRIRRDGSRFWANSVLTALRGDDGTLIGYGKVMRDLTERKHAEETLAQKNEELARSNRELEQFAYVASHDLQEPLRMVASYVQLLAKRYQGTLSKEADEFIGYAVDGATRMQQLINDLLMFSRVGTRGVELRPVSMEATLNTVISGLQILIRETGATITHDPLPTVCGDPTQLGQLLQNLIGNAVKFRGPEAPHVHITATREGEDWRFSVRDNGIGIDPQYHDRIFVIFQRLHARGEYQGTGIGLAVCKKIVERHGGKIWVDSSVGNGTTFNFTLPGERAR